MKNAEQLERLLSEGRGFGGGARIGSPRPRRPDVVGEHLEKEAQHLGKPRKRGNAVRPERAGSLGVSDNPH